MEFTEIMLQLFLYSLIAVFSENLVFSRGLGTSTALSYSRKSKNIYIFGGILTCMSLVISLSSYGINLLIKNVSFRQYIRPLLFIAAATVIYYVIYILLKRFGGAFGKVILPHLPYAIFNCTLFGAVYIAIGGKFNIVQTIGFSLGSGVGFTLAALFIAEGRRRLEDTDLPEAFKGLPAMFVYIGILALGFYGLVGHLLPM